MSSRRTLGRSRIAATGALGLAVLLAVGGVAQSRSTHRTARPHAPLRAIVYLTTPMRAGGAAGRPLPSVSRDDSRGRRAASVCARVGPRRRRDRPVVARLARGSEAGCRAHGDRLRARACAWRGPAGSATRQRGAPDRAARDVARRGSRIPPHRFATRGFRRTRKPCPPHLRACASLASSSALVLARAGDLPGLRTLPQRGRLLVSGHARHCAAHARAARS